MYCPRLVPTRRGNPHPIRKLRRGMGGQWQRVQMTWLRSDRRERCRECSLHLGHRPRRRSSSYHLQDVSFEEQELRKVYISACQLPKQRRSLHLESRGLEAVSTCRKTCSVPTNPSSQLELVNQSCSLLFLHLSIHQI
jgi:hypothetical protein